MRFVYADPPYLGCAGFYEGSKEVNHRLLIAYLDEFDGWALSSHSPGLRTILPMCPDDVRVMAWVKPFASFKPSVRVAYAWEPVLVRGGRQRPRTVDTVRDWVAASITLQRGFVGAKPDVFCCWLFEVLGIDPDQDEFVDLFPGSGAVTRAFRAWCAARPLPFQPHPEQIGIAL